MDLNGLDRVGLKNENGCFKVLEVVILMLNCAPRNLNGNSFRNCHFLHEQSLGG